MSLLDDLKKNDLYKPYSKKLDKLLKGGPGSGPQGGKSSNHTVRGALKDSMKPEHTALAEKISARGAVGDLTDYLASRVRGGFNSEKMRDHLDSKV